MGIVNEKSSTTSLYLCSNTFVLHLEPHVLHVGFFYACIFLIRICARAGFLFASAEEK